MVAAKLFSKFLSYAIADELGEEKVVFIDFFQRQKITALQDKKCNS